MDFHKELRRTYFGAAPHTLCVGLLWILSGVLSNFASKGFTILFFFFACGVNFPLGELLRKVLKIKDVLSKENNLPRLFTFLSFTIPLSIPVVYMACKFNINWFFPAFAVIVGAHYLPFIWAYRMPTFGILGGIVILIGIICALRFQESFPLAAYITGATMVLFGIVHYILISKEVKEDSNSNI
jgi:hypothetical protein